MKSIGLLFSFFVIFSASACAISGSNLHSVSKSHPKAPSQNQTEKANVQPASIAPALKPLSFDVPKGVFYEVYVNSFYDSNGDGNGDLKGLTEKLDVLNDGNPKTDTDLGVDGLWLMPINPSPSYHKYDVTNYEAIDPTYGTTKDLQQLVQGPIARGQTSGFRSLYFFYH
jgi:alpha-amylase